ncbi:hypothetical protein BDV98DRAFT_120481 [Pterulicium gracile]|uniref:Aminoglycoside phosphotransferase domain-containing protein n=1 Tax=Pterulicium gracile TaxID=1884261 RepID=A0A5C3QF35_9AGAR|nr:hypothetical protein BDV98DRAFT_120481 [Pterula gracilis]
MKGKAFRLTSGLVLKDGQPDDMAAEVEALAFVAAHTSIPVPHVKYHWLELNRREPRGYIVMNLMPGEMLARVWSKLSPAQRQHVMRSLSGYVSQLRLLSQPPPPRLSPLPPKGWIGSTSGRGFMDCSMTTQIPPSDPLQRRATSTTSGYRDTRFLLGAQTSSRMSDDAWHCATTILSPSRMET